MKPTNRYELLRQLLNSAADSSTSTPVREAPLRYRYLFDLKTEDPTQPLPESDDGEHDFSPFVDSDFTIDNLPSSQIFLSRLQQSCDSYTAQDQYLPDDDNSICSIDEALSLQWEYDSYATLLRNKSEAEMSPNELMDEVRPIMSKQNLPNAYHNIALLMAKKLPLISIDHSLYCRNGAIFESMNADDLYDSLCDISDKSIHGGIKRSGRKELYSATASVRSIQVNEADIVRNPNLIPLIDKIYDIETGRFHEPQSNEIFFSRINLYSNELGVGDNCLLERFLDTSFGGDQHIIERFMQVQGAILSPYTPKAVFHYWGPHNSGKSESVRLISQFLAPQSKFVHSIDDPNRLTEQFALSPLLGKRLMICPDASKLFFKEATCATLKQLTGGRDLIGANVKNGAHITFVNEAKPLIVSNHALRGDFDEAFISRIVTIPFQHTIPPERRILNLAERIFESRGSFFLAAMQALRRLIEHNFVFAPIDCPPSYVISNCEKGGVVSIGDSVYSFVSECCILESGVFSSSKDLFDAYLNFCAEQQLEAIQDKAVFGRTLHAAFPAIENKRTASYHGFLGIRLIAQEH